MPTGRVTVTTSSTLILAEAERKMITVTNLSASTTVWITFNGESVVTGAAGANPGIPLRPGDTWLASEEDRRSTVPNQAVYGITESGTADVGFTTLN